MLGSRGSREMQTKRSGRYKIGFNNLIQVQIGSNDFQTLYILICSLLMSKFLKILTLHAIMINPSSWNENRIACRRCNLSRKNSPLAARVESV